MSYEERPAKRMRINNTGNHESEITEDEVFYSPAFESANALGMVGREVYECCYGMLSDIAVKKLCSSETHSSPIRVEFRSPNRLSSGDDHHSTTFDISGFASAQILNDLASVPEIKTQLYCHSKIEFDHGGPSRRMIKRSGKLLGLWFLNVIIFGPHRFVEKIGEYLSIRKMYLQDTLGCERCVPYRNPHAMTPDTEEVVMTDLSILAPGYHDVEELKSGPDLLAQLMEGEAPLRETEAPKIVKASLFRHQKQALTFMQRREEGWNFDDAVSDIWSWRTSNQACLNYELPQAHPRSSELGLSSMSKATLLIVPPALREHQFRLQFDVVITTYHTIAAIWKHHSAHQDDESLYSFTWHRVVLDEARACCALKATRRWAITGTPIQNKLVDFASIVKFLRVHLYSDTRIFVEEITKPFRNSSSMDAKGLLRHKTLVRAITISRTKAVIELPSRVDEIHHLNFTSAEREKYEAEKLRARVERSISSGNQNGKTFNALALLNRLRLICNHGLLQLTPTKDHMVSQGSEVISCSMCGDYLQEEVFGGPFPPGIDIQRQPLCEQCILQEGDNCDRSPSNSLNFTNTAEDLRSVTPPTVTDIAFSIQHMSTKINALLADLRKYKSAEKSVVFSYWTNTLDLVQMMLENQGIHYTRIDGTMSLSKRNEALGAFKNKDTVRVIFVSITCGGAGLDLTTGLRAYLLEPHWGPMIEEQALCRVHRISQKRNVTTIRYLMHDSFEEQIVDLQKRKKMLADVTFSQNCISEAGVDMSILQYLRSVLE
ncbi:putative snf2 family helicase protein [Botrytis fragariae]|uniref:Putative snf2 family helicase protein n=1 Tax=Botrytis fragariae TaxID=1964551 RepID=A0A8H6EIA7_9HELO|nr:putative snf2 family helicase protein [Botrytis fragariae]KAF5873287.1 putative snf2 family helicase protein [Botrytis fragariae]